MPNESNIYGRGLTSKAVQEILSYYDTLPSGESYWESMAEGYTSTYNTGKQSLEESFSRAVDEAYRSRIQQERMLETSGVVGTGKQALSGNLQDVFNQAYESYRSTLSENMSKLQESYLKNIQDLQTQYEERSANFAKLSESYYDYAKYIFENYYGVTNPNIDSPFDTGAAVNWNSLLVPAYDKDGNQVFDENENPVMTLKDKQTLYNELYDPMTGELTGKGIAFYDLLENRQYQGVTSYGQWLQETDPELYSWAYDRGQNTFDSSSDGTNAGTFREMTGRASTDYTYTWIEHVASLDEGEIKSVFKPLATKLNELSNVDMKEKAAGYLESLTPVVQEVKDLALELGIYQDMEEMGFDWDKLMSLPEEARKEVRSSSQLTGDWWKAFASGIGIGAAFGAVVGTGAGGPIGTAAGAALGALGGGFFGAWAGTDVNKAAKSKNELKGTEVKNTFDTLIRSMTQYAVDKSRRKYGQ